MIGNIELKKIIIKELSDVKNSDGSNYFSTDWVREKILGIKDKFEERKFKIKKILKDK